LSLGHFISTFEPEVNSPKLTPSHHDQLKIGWMRLAHSSFVFSRRLLVLPLWREESDFFEIEDEEAGTRGGI
jgi:hypothetical protein